jgi:hypothetical protein
VDSAGAINSARIAFPPTARLRSEDAASCGAAPTRISSGSSYNDNDNNDNNRGRPVSLDDSGEISAHQTAITGGERCNIPRIAHDIWSDDDDR